VAAARLQLVNVCFQSSLKSPTGRFNKVHGALRSPYIARVSQQRLYENCPQMTEKEQYGYLITPNLNAVEISCLGSDARSYFETFSSKPN